MRSQVVRRRTMCNGPILYILDASCRSDTHRCICRFSFRYRHVQAINESCTALCFVRCISGFGETWKVRNHTFVALLSWGRVSQCTRLGTLDYSIHRGNGLAVPCDFKEQGNTMKIYERLKSFASSYEPADIVTTRSLPLCSTDLHGLEASWSFKKSSEQSCNCSVRFHAAQDGQLNIVKCLVQAAADLDKSAEDGATPLIIAAQSEQLKIVRFLAKVTADLKLACESAPFWYGRFGRSAAPESQKTAITWFRVRVRNLEQQMPVCVAFATI